MPVRDADDWTFPHEDVSIRQANWRQKILLLFRTDMVHMAERRSKWQAVRRTVAPVDSQYEPETLFAFNQLGAEA